MKTKLYNIMWKCHTYGQSGVFAQSKEEAKQKALDGKDFEFEMFDPTEDWEIVSVEFVEDTEEDENEIL